MIEQQRRPPLVTVFAIACWADALSRLFTVSIRSPYVTYSHWYLLIYQPFTHVLGLFPTPGAIPYMAVALKYKGLNIDSRPQILLALSIGAVLSALLGFGLWRMHRWARWATIVLVPLSVVLTALLPTEKVFKPIVSMLEIWRRGGFIASIVFGASLVYVLARQSAFAITEEKTTIPATSNKSTGVVIVITSILVLLNGYLAWIFWQGTLHHRDGKVILWPAFLWWVFPLLTVFTVVRLMRKGPGAFALGLAAGISILELVQAAPAILALPFLILFGVGVFGVMAAVAIPLNLINGGFALAALRKLPRPPVYRAGNAALAMFLPFAAFALVMDLAELQSKAVDRPPITPEQSKRWAEEHSRQQFANQQLQVVARCAFQYFQQHPDEGFPAELQQLGPEGSHCMPAIFPGQSDSRYQFSYEAGRYQSDGKVDHFIYSATQTGATRPSMTIDENGISSANGFIYNRALVLLLDVQNCLERYRFKDPANRYPATLTPVLAMKEDYGPECVHFYSGNDKFTDWPAGSPIHFSDYELTYSSTGDKYIIAARPEHWGDKFFRSYLIDESGMVHGTPFNRPAKLEDPEIKDCEIGGSGACYNGPWNFEFIEGGIPKQ